MTQAYLQAYRKATGGSVEYLEIPIGLASNPGVPSVASGVSTTEEAGAIRRTTFTISALPITIVDAGAAGSQGGVQIYTFPTGLTQIFGGRMSLTLAGDEDKIAADAAFVASVGTVVVAVDNAALTTTEADIIPSTSCTLSGSAGTASGITATAPGLFDGSSTAKVAFLNFACPDAGTSADGPLTVSGTITIAWMVT